MDFRVFAQSIAAGVLFAGPLALAYRWFRRGRPEAASHAWKIFIVLALIIAARVYFLYATG